MLPLIVAVIFVSNFVSLQAYLLDLGAAFGGQAPPTFPLPSGARKEIESWINAGAPDNR